MANRSSQLIIMLVAVLLAVIAGSALVLWFLGSSESPTTLAPTPEVAVPLQPGDDAFNTGVLRSSDYTTLDQQFVTDGSLPVQPPAAVGKANPFL